MIFTTQQKRKLSKLVSKMDKNKQQKHGLCPPTLNLSKSSKSCSTTSKKQTCMIKMDILI